MVIAPEDIRHAQSNHRSWPWSLAWEGLLAIEAHLDAEKPVWTDTSRFNWRLERARLWIKYLQTMTVLQLVEPREDRLAKRVALLEDILAWPSWSGEGSYDLSTGELAVCLSGTLLFASEGLSEELCVRLRNALAERAVEPYGALVLETAKEKAVWWWKGGGNWSAVCNAGAYCASFVMQEPSLKAAAWEGLASFIDSLPRDGGSLESVSYWEYGLRYLTYALLYREWSGEGVAEFSHSEPLSHGVSFFNAFIDGRSSVGFGDCNFTPPEGLLLRFCDLVGDVSGRKKLEQGLIDYLGFQNAGRNGFRYIWNQPREAQALLYMKGNGGSWEPENLTVRHFPETGWASLRNGSLLLGFRAGDNTGSHAMRDQLAVNLTQDGVPLLRYTENHPYTAGWFNGNSENTRDLYFEAQSVSKNTLLVNGIGQIRKGRVELEPLEDGASAEAASLYPVFVKTACRQVRIDGQGFRLVDQIQTLEICHHEIRFFSDGHIDTRDNQAVRISMAGKAVDLHISAQVPLQFVTTRALPSIGIRDGWRMLRVVTREPVLESTITTTILPTFP